MPEALHLNDLESAPPISTPDRPLVPTYRFSTSGVFIPDSSLSADFPAGADGVQMLALATSLVHGVESPSIELTRPGAHTPTAPTPISSTSRSGNLTEHRRPSLRGSEHVTPGEAGLARRTHQRSVPNGRPVRAASGLRLKETVLHRAFVQVRKRPS